MALTGERPLVGLADLAVGDVALDAGDGAPCPYCMIVRAVTIPVFWYATLHNTTRGHLPVPAPLKEVVASTARYHTVVLTIGASADSAGTSSSTSR